MDLVISRAASIAKQARVAKLSVDHSATFGPAYWHTTQGKKMGGSGSGGFTPTAPSNPCANLAFQAAINSPQASVIGQLNVGSILSVHLNKTGNGVEVHHKKQVAGSLTGTHVAQLVNCMNSGFEYEATVVTLDGGNCVVRVEAK